MEKESKVIIADVSDSSEGGNRCLGTLTCLCSRCTSYKEKLTERGHYCPLHPRVIVYNGYQQMPCKECTNMKKKEEEPAHSPYSYTPEEEQKLKDIAMEILKDHKKIGTDVPNDDMYDYYEARAKALELSIASFGKDVSDTGDSAILETAHIYYDFLMGRLAQA
jgi:hypothetical protein